MYQLELSRAELIRIKNTLDNHRQEQYQIMSKLKSNHKDWTVKYQLLSESIAINNDIIQTINEILFEEPSSETPEIIEDGA